MTGYGSAVVASDNYKVTVELKSLNSKFFELALKLPRLYLQYEHKLRATLTSELERGKVSVFVNVEVLNAEKRSLNLNMTLAAGYLREVEALREQLELPDAPTLAMLLNMPEVIPTDMVAADPEEWELIEQATYRACARLLESRAEEGAALYEDLVARKSAILTELAEVELLAPERMENVRQRIHAALDELRERAAHDENRFEQELIYYLERLDINEEFVRLRQHCAFFQQLLDAAQSNGKQLNFIAQEMGREINTIGSKAQDARIQRHVVAMKDELEKIKEQVLNVV